MKIDRRSLVLGSLGVLAGGRAGAAAERGDAPEQRDIIQAASWSTFHLIEPSHEVSVIIELASAGDETEGRGADGRHVYNNCAGLSLASIHASC